MVDVHAQPVAVPAVSMRSLPRTLRSRETQPCTTFGHDGGGVSPQIASASDSARTTAPGRTANASSTTRSRRPMVEVVPSSSSGPSTAIPTPRMSTLARPVKGRDTAVIPGRLPPGTALCETAGGHLVRRSTTELHLTEAGDQMFDSTQQPSRRPHRPAGRGRASPHRRTGHALFGAAGGRAEPSPARPTPAECLPPA